MFDFKAARNAFIGAMVGIALFAGLFGWAEYVSNLGLALYASIPLAFFPIAVVVCVFVGFVKGRRP